jgi:alanine racemase
MLNWIEVDAAALRHNFRVFADLVGKSSLVPILKSNGYGHGLTLVHEALSAEDPEWLGVNYIDEAKELRALGFTKRILVVGPAVPEQLAQAAQISAEIVVGHEELLVHSQNHENLSVHIKFDTGMGRQGFDVADADKVIALAKRKPDAVKGLCSHFANVEDVTEQAYAEKQLQDFQHVSQMFKENGFAIKNHISASASCLIMDSSRFDLVRVGISMYGLWPSQATKISYLQTRDEVADLRPALSWYTRITSIREVPAGQFIGYGCTFRTNHQTRVAVLPVGYYEGYPRIAGDHGSYVLIKGNRCPILGRICMNMMMVDVTHVETKLGDRVTLIGQDGEETIHASDLANWSQSIHYELVSRLNHEIPRKLIAGI